jgi:hypothetical protein
MGMHFRVQKIRLIKRKVNQRRQRGEKKVARIEANLRRLEIC